MARYDVVDTKTARTARTSRPYRRKRARFLRDNPLCAECDQEGHTEVAEELHHKVSVEQRPDLFWEESNWEGLCAPCHWQKKSETRGCDVDGIPNVWRKRYADEGEGGDRRRRGRRDARG